MSGLATVAVSLTRRWVHLYTRNLPDCDLAPRRDEIDSDLWEHQSSGRHMGQSPTETGVEILVRLVLGMPADLAWRRAAMQGAARAGRQIAQPSKISKGGVMAMKRALRIVGAILTLVIGLVNLLDGPGLVSSGGISGLGAFLLQAMTAASGGLLIAGVVASFRLARLGAILVTIGALLGAAFYSLMAMIGALPSDFGPVQIAVIAVAISLPLLLAFFMVRRALLRARLVQKG